ncbi:NAD(P)H-dependent FMN reductase [Kineosphaera limosa]|uniref:Putative oxidoreductase n=1 Tax=Kineosphaera limosa NBRC 100340 TaxID=1184609 RepID=K6W8F0_9MICO|nr:NADPH-dependent FMN reductase [Kineosphaera limosa]NYE01353.1 NAD(P)H-dependent FMN reductase [Kineosphaera limosa]GAB95475.1 putative oxidoreductase [Kineosphaera limosa NBRC 100340]
MKIGIIEGSIREGRSGASVAKWVAQQAQGRDAEYVLLVLADFDVPLLTSPVVPGAAKKQYDSPQVQAWSDAIDSCDGFVFVTPEYNHSVPGAFKNAFDSLGNEWSNKSVGFVSYGAECGVRAVEHWRQIVANFNMIGVRTQVSLSTFAEFDDAQCTPNERRPKELSNLFKAVEGRAGLLAQARRPNG